MLKRIFTVFACICILYYNASAAFAVDIPQQREDCSIEISVRFDGVNISSGTLTAIKVGNLCQENNNYFFCREITGEKILDVDSSAAPDAFKKFYENNADNYSFLKQTLPIINGKVTFSNLPTGLYLIIQNEAADGFYRLNPSVVSIPYYDNGEYRYNISMSIKSEPERETEPESTTLPPTEPDPELPNTGILRWPIPVLASMGMVLLIIGFWFSFRKKEIEQ